MRVLGFDPGSQKLGWGLVEQRDRHWRRVESGTIRLGARRPLPERLQTVYEAASAILSTHAPGLAAVEECFVSHSPKAALVLGEVRGVLLLAIQQAGIRIEEFAPRSVKLATVGNGPRPKNRSST